MQCNKWKKQLHYTVANSKNDYTTLQQIIRKKLKCAAANNKKNIVFSNCSATATGQEIKKAWWIIMERT